jgi:hypothetical protein
MVSNSRGTATFRFRNGRGSEKAICRSNSCRSFPSKTGCSVNNS